MADTIKQPGKSMSSMTASQPPILAGRRLAFVSRLLLVIVAARDGVHLCAFQSLAVFIDCLDFEPHFLDVLTLYLVVNNHHLKQAVVGNVGGYAFALALLAARGENE